MSATVTGLFLDWNKKIVAKSIVLNNYSFPTVKDAKFMFQDINDDFWNTTAGYNFVNTKNKGFDLLDAHKYLKIILSWDTCSEEIRNLINTNSFSFTLLSRWRSTLERIPYLIFIVDTTETLIDYKMAILGLKHDNSFTFEEDPTEALRKTLKSKVYDELNGFFYKYQAPKPADWRAYFFGDNMTFISSNEYVFKIDPPQEAWNEMKLEREEE